MNVSYIEISDYLKKKIREEPFFESFEEEKEWLIEQMKNTIETGESTSALIVDLTKSSTTRMVDDAVNEIKASLGDNCTLIQLYGQLHSEADNAFHEIVDNLSVDCSADVEIMGAIADKVDYVLKCIRDENENKPVIFIFNEFHLFCDEGENTLIYPMIDVLHSKVPICVIGVTADQTCIQRLGKRVTSRFSGKTIYLESKNIDNRNLTAFQTLLSLDTPHFPKKFVEEWNQNIDNLSSDPAISQLIKYVGLNRFSEEEFRQILFLVACRLDTKKKPLVTEDIVECIESFLTPSYPEVLNSLSAIELCLVIAIQHHLTILGEPTFNFKAIFNRYNKVKCRTNKIPQMSEQQGKKAFESLISLGLVKQLQLGTSELVEYIPCRFRPDSYSVKQYIEESSNVQDFLKQWVKDPLINQ